MVNYTKRRGHRRGSDDEDDGDEDGSDEDESDYSGSDDGRQPYHIGACATLRPTRGGSEAELLTSTLQRLPSSTHCLACQARRAGPDVPPMHAQQRHGLPVPAGWPPRDVRGAAVPPPAAGPARRGGHRHELYGDGMRGRRWCAWEALTVPPWPQYARGAGAGELCRRIYCQFYDGQCRQPNAAATYKALSGTTGRWPVSTAAAASAHARPCRSAFLVASAFADDFPTMPVGPRGAFRGNDYEYNGLGPATGWCVVA